MPSPRSEIFFIDSLKKIKKEDWNSCVDNDHPFIQYEFLFALEESKSACSQTGWKPYHYIEYNDVEDEDAIKVFTYEPFTDDDEHTWMSLKIIMDGNDIEFSTSYNRRTKKLDKEVIL